MTCFFLSHQGNTVSCQVRNRVISTSKGREGKGGEERIGKRYRQLKGEKRKRGEIRAREGERKIKYNTTSIEGCLLFLRRLKQAELRQPEQLC